MVRKIEIVQYKKIKSLNFDFINGVNVISGTNGTCKTSLLHIISNAFQAVTTKCEWIKDTNCLGIIARINDKYNYKIESLTKGDKTHNDPANGYKGTLFAVYYTSRELLSFRKHNSATAHRYSVKPHYKQGSGDSLPKCPVIYLGLARLFPFGEFQDDTAVQQINKDLPEQYQKELLSLYNRFTHVEISSAVSQKMGSVKMRMDFSSNAQGIDSNTISAGEDNLLIILKALISLKYYYESIQSNNDIESILLIDELDATLHPSFQFKILELFRDFSKKYKIQIVFTTHSLSLLEVALDKKDNVIYLMDNVTSVLKLDEPDIYKIRMYLQNQTSNDIYGSKKIPIFTEDAEARFFLKIIFEYYERKAEFAKVSRFFHFVEANIGCENLYNIFRDNYLIKSTMQSICILDGDQHSKQNYNNYTIALPGGKSPETLIMDYSVQLFDCDDSFWVEHAVTEQGYTKPYYLDKIKPDIDGISQKLQELKTMGQSAHGVERELRKKVFYTHERFFELLFKHWTNNPDNKAKVDKFYKDLFVMFCKTATFHGINPALWVEED